MSAGPVVSVVTTAYNRERYLARAIESVLAQTYADFELIVVDDGSTDRTVAVARAYEGDPRVRVVVNEPWPEVDTGEVVPNPTGAEARNGVGGFDAEITGALRSCLHQTYLMPGVMVRPSIGWISSSRKG